MPDAAPHPLVRFPNGTFLENLVLRPDGAVLFTSYFARTVEAWSPAAGAFPFATLPVHPVSLAALPDGGFALAFHGVLYTEGPAALRGTGGVLLLDAAGQVRRRLPLPEGLFLNGCLLTAPETLLVADSTAGCVWSLDLGSGAVGTWLADPALAPDPAQPGRPGVNGIKPAAGGGAMLLSNSVTRQLSRVPLDAAGQPAGPPVPVATFPGIDDFCVLPDGTVWAATHGPAIARLAPGATVAEAFPAPGLEGNTALLPAPDGSGLYVLGTGGISAGGTGEAMLALVPWPG
jgi:sugar lactone lactonase YvrE